MDPTDLERVNRSAHLARLALNDVRAAQLGGELGHILEAFRTLARVDVEGVDPLARPEVPTGGPREDEPSPSLKREELLSRAPHPRDGFYGVPKTVDRSSDGDAAS